MAIEAKKIEVDELEYNQLKKENADIKNQVAKLEKALSKLYNLHLDIIAKYIND